MNPQLRQAPRCLSNFGGRFLQLAEFRVQAFIGFGGTLQLFKGISLLKGFELPFTFDQSNPKSMPLPSRAPRRPLQTPAETGNWRSSMFGRAFSASPRASAHEEVWGERVLEVVPDFDSSQTEAQEDSAWKVFLPT